MELLKVEHLTKVIKKKTIINDLSFTINSGEIVGFLGPNGAGKTTTIKVVLGLFAITSGSVKICGKDIVTDFEDAIKNVGGIVENPDLYKRMTGRGNLRYYASMYDNVGEEAISQVAELVKMGARIDDKVKSYSLGMRQRVGLGQALLHKPRLLVLDEPTNGLDPIGIKELRDLLKYLAKQAGTGVFISSHLLSEMEIMCDRIYIIDNGVLIGEKRINGHEESAEEELIFKYAFMTSNNQKVYEMFSAMNTNCTLMDNEVQLIMKRSEIPGIIKSLIDAGVDIYAVNQRQRSLEDDFISMTTGSKSQIR